MEPLDVSYRFRFTEPEPRETAVVVKLDPRTLEPRQPPAADTPRWVALDYHQCPNCPLNPREVPHCPLARALQPLVEHFGERRSYLPVQLEVTTKARTVSAQTTVQEAVGALMGLLIATSGCPHTHFLKPMARFHLPLATPEETFYRVVSMYSLAQHFRGQHWLPLDFGFSDLFRRYAELERVNEAVAQRIRFACREDGTVNAIVLLDALAQYLPASLEESLAALEPLFHGYLEGDK